MTKSNWRGSTSSAGTRSSIGLILVVSAGMTFLAFLLASAIRAEALGSESLAPTDSDQLDQTTLKSLEQLQFPDAQLPGTAVHRATLLFANKLSEAYPEYGKALSAAKNEFEKRDVERNQSSEITQRAEEEKRQLLGKIWLVRIPVKTGEYDFKRGFFELKAPSNDPYGGAWSLAPGVVKVGPLSFVGGYVITRNSPFESAADIAAASYRLTLDETTAREFRTLVGSTGKASVELALRLLGYGKHPYSRGLSQENLLAEVVAHRIVGTNGPLTTWRAHNAGSAELTKDAKPAVDSGSARDSCQGENDQSACMSKFGFTWDGFKWVRPAELTHDARPAADSGSARDSCQGENDQSACMSKFGFTWDGFKWVRK